MASVVAQMKVRQGNLADLPILQPGEFGYATDVSRLYIGNVPPTPQAGDGTTTIFTFSGIDTDSDGTTDNNATLDFGNKLTYAVYLDDGTNETLQQNGTDYTTQDSSITFTTAPASGTSVKVYYINLDEYTDILSCVLYPVACSNLTFGNSLATFNIGSI